MVISHIHGWNPEQRNNLRSSVDYPLFHENCTTQLRSSNSTILYFGELFGCIWLSIDYNSVKI